MHLERQIIICEESPINKVQGLITRDLQVHDGHRVMSYTAGGEQQM